MRRTYLCGFRRQESTVEQEQVKRIKLDRRRVLRGVRGLCRQSTAVHSLNRKRGWKSSRAVGRSSTAGGVSPQVRRHTRVPATVCTERGDRGQMWRCVSDRLYRHTEDPDRGGNRGGSARTLHTPNTLNNLLLNVPCMWRLRTGWRLKRSSASSLKFCFMEAVLTWMLMYDVISNKVGSVIKTCLWFYSYSASGGPGTASNTSFLHSGELLCICDHSALKKKIWLPWKAWWTSVAQMKIMFTEIDLFMFNIQNCYLLNCNYIMALCIVSTMFKCSINQSAQVGLMPLSYSFDMFCLFIWLIEWNYHEDLGASPEAKQSVPKA